MPEKHSIIVRVRAVEGCFLRRSVLSRDAISFPTRRKYGNHPLPTCSSHALLEASSRMPLLLGFRPTARLSNSGRHLSFRSTHLAGLFRGIN